jgi:hypothetical protein
MYMRERKSERKGQGREIDREGGPFRMWMFVEEGRLHSERMQKVETQKGPLQRQEARRGRGARSLSKEVSMGTVWVSERVPERV